MVALAPGLALYALPQWAAALPWAPVGAARVDLLDHAHVSVFHATVSLPAGAPTAVSLARVASGVGVDGVVMAAASHGCGLCVSPWTDCALPAPKWGTLLALLASAVGTGGTAPPAV